jgi:RluA family pseudouridine synthase
MPRRPAIDRGPRLLPGGVPIAYEDDAILVVDKPAGILTAAPPGVRSKNIFAAVKEYARTKTRGSSARAWIIHRLDKEASGLLVFAKSEEAFHWLKEDFRAKRVHRLYAAVVEGELPAGQAGTIQSYLYEDAEGLMHSVDSPAKVPKPRANDSPREDDGNPAKLAVTHYRVVHSGQGRSLLQVRLETGRKNQIRVHLAQLKHPIAGDRRYGATSDPAKRVCLHAAELGVQHPASGRTLRVVSPPPGIFRSLVGMAPEPAETDRAGNDAQKTPERTPKKPGGWDHVAEWYDKLVGEGRSDHHERVVIPGALRLLGIEQGERVLDVACGEGVLSRTLAELGARVTGIDAAPRLIESARRFDPRSRYLVGDARSLHAHEHPEPYDAAACVLALMNIEPISPVLEGVRALLTPGGRFVMVILHPAFRSPGQTSWGWDKPAPGSRGKLGTQYRRVDGYLSHGQREIVMNPGAASSGRKAITTVTHHRPVQAYVAALAKAKFVIDALEEWPSARTSQPGPAAAEENRARREIPVFLALRARCA